MTTTKKKPADKKKKRFDIGEFSGKIEMKVSDKGIEVKGLKELKEKLENLTQDEVKRKVIKRIPAKKKFQDSFHELYVMSEEVKNLFGKITAYREKLWAEIHIDLGIFDGNFHYDDVKKEIQVLENDEE